MATWKFDGNLSMSVKVEVEAPAVCQSAASRHDEYNVARRLAKARLREVAGAALDEAARLAGGSYGWNVEDLESDGPE